MKTINLKTIMGLLFLFVFVFAAVITVTTSNALAGIDYCCYDPGNGYGHWEQPFGEPLYCQCRPNHPLPCDGYECDCFHFCLV